MVCLESCARRAKGETPDVLHGMMYRRFECWIPKRKNAIHRRRLVYTGLETDNGMKKNLQDACIQTEEDGRAKVA